MTKCRFRTADVSKCVHCHICQKNCVFLAKYGIDIGDTDRLNELAYHCFFMRTLQRGLSGGD